MTDGYVLCHCDMAEWRHTSGLLRRSRQTTRRKGTRRSLIGGNDVNAGVMPTGGTTFRIPHKKLQTGFLPQRRVIDPNASNLTPKSLSRQVYDGHSAVFWTHMRQSPTRTGAYILSLIHI